MFAKSHPTTKKSNYYQFCRSSRGGEARPTTHLSTSQDDDNNKNVQDHFFRRLHQHHEYKIILKIQNVCNMIF